MVNDPIGDMLAQVKNAAACGKSSVDMPYSNFKMAVAKILEQEGYVSAIKKTGTAPKLRLSIRLKYTGKTSAITDMKRRSKPGLRVYVTKDAIPRVVGGMGIAILSTSAGIMTGKEAKKRGLGGEVLCEVW